MLLNYHGPNLSFERISALEVFTGEVDPQTFENRIVLVGLTSTESKTWINVPAFGEINEVERIATVTSNIIHHDFLKHSSPLWNVLVLILIGVFCALVLPNVSLTYRIVILLVFLFVVFNFSYILFSSFGILTKPVYPIIELLLFLAASPAIKPKELRRKGSEAEVKEGEIEERADEADIAVDQAAETPAEVEELASTGITAGEPTGEKDREEDLHPIEAKTDQAGQERKTHAPDSPPEVPAEQTMKLSERPTPGASCEPSPTPTPLSETPPVSRFGRYKIIEILGRGGMGTVYKGMDPALDRPVALKTIRLDFAVSRSEISELRERLVQEAKAAGRLSHPNIVTIYDVGEEEGLQYIAMEHLSGYTLEDFIKKKGVLNYKIAAKIIMQTCDALSYAHQHGIVHRDIKPANIMLLEDFHVKVMDFGIARLETTSLTKSNVALGTPHYISPEQLEGNLADKRSDIFSLGVVIYELLTKKKPFQGENISSLMYRILNHQPPPPSAIDDRIPMIFDQVVSKAMAKRPEDRYRDAKEITRIMREFVSSFVVTRSIRI
jgi:serine/threonine-protein kinase